ncbi:MAG: hypothetical protein PUK14_02530 [Clostridiales bacterium]|nr:hypothetical protein [Clostridiales bacterium]
MLKDEIISKGRVVARNVKKILCAKCVPKLLFQKILCARCVPKLMFQKILCAKCVPKLLFQKILCANCVPKLVFQKNLCANCVPKRRKKVKMYKNVCQNVKYCVPKAEICHHFKPLILSMPHAIWGQFFLMLF